MEVSSKALPLPFLPDGESCHDSLYCEKCQCFLWEPCWQHAVVVQDGYSLPLAFASLPDVLAFHHVNPLQNVKQCAEDSAVPTVVARATIRPQTVFGPFIAPVCDAGAAHSQTYSSADGQCVTFNLENDRWCNWMKLVRTADHGQYNLRVFVREQNVLFVAVKVILPGEELTLSLCKHDIDRKKIHHDNLGYAAARVDCTSGSIFLAEDSCMTGKGDDRSEDADVEAMSVDIPQNAFTAGFSVDDSHLPLAPDEQTDVLPQSQPLPAQLDEQLPALSTVKCEQLPALPFSSNFCSAALDPVSRKATDSVKRNHEDKKPAPLLVMHSFKREDSPEYPFPFNFSSATTAAVIPKAVDTGKCKSEMKESTGVKSRQTAFARVYSLRGSNVVRASAACSDQEFTDDNDEDFRLSGDDDSPSTDSEYCSEVEVDLDECVIRTKKRGRKRRTVNARSKVPLKKIGSVVCKDTPHTVSAIPDSSASGAQFGLPNAAFLEARNRQIRAVIAVNPFQYPAGEQRLLAFSTAATLLLPDQALLGMKKLDGPALERSIEQRLYTFKRLQRTNRMESVWRPEEYVSLMNQLTALSNNSSECSITQSERIRRLKVVAKINPFQYSSKKERSAAWTAAWQAYRNEVENGGPQERKSKQAMLPREKLPRFVKMHLDNFPQTLDGYNEDTASQFQREYIQVMQVIAQQAGRGYADAVVVHQLNAAVDTQNAHSKRRPPQSYPTSSRFYSYVYRFVCGECSFHFKDETVLKLHKMQHNDAPNDTTVSLECPACQRSFQKLPNLFRHVMDHGVKASQIVNFIPTADPSIMSCPASTAVPMDVLAQSHDAHETCFMYSCGMVNCGLRFCTEAMCDLHQLSHNVPDDYQGDVVCAGCNYVAANAEDLLKHVGRHAAKKNDRKLCRLCGEFVQNMVVHVRDKHKEEYLKYEARLTLPCDQCEKRFRTPVQLAAHNMWAHKDEHGRLRCLVCTEPFPSARLLYAHTKKEHTTGLTCAVCQKSWPTYARLYAHAKTHKEIHTCRTCGSAFRSISKLFRHQRTHRSVHSSKCDVCGKTFKVPSNLARHKTTAHTGKMRKKRKAKREDMRRKRVVREFKTSRQRSDGDDAGNDTVAAMSADVAGWFSFDDLLPRSEPPPAPSEEPFTRVYPLRGRNGVSTAVACSDQDFSDDSDRDFCLSGNDEASSTDSEGCSEVEEDLDDTMTKQRGTVNAKAKRSKSLRRCAEDTGTLMCTDTANTVSPVYDSLAWRGPDGGPNAAFLEARNRLIRAVIAVNPFQYPEGEQRLQAFFTAASMLPADQLLPGMKKLDGSVLQRTIEMRLVKFKNYQRNNRVDSVWRPAEYVSLMKALAALQANQRTATKSEKMRRLNAVAKINPFQYSSPGQRSAAWIAAWQAYLADCADAPERKSKKTLTCAQLQHEVQMHLEKLPRALDGYNEDTADMNKREYIEVMRVIAQQVGKDLYADGPHVVTSTVNGDGVDQWNAATNTALAPSKPRRYKKSERDRRFFSYVYRFVCWECSLHFKDENVLKLHNMQHRDIPSETTVSLDCPACQRSFRQLSNLLRHVVHHGVNARHVIHFIPTDDPSIMSFASKTAAPMDVVAQSHDAHETCFMYSCGMQKCGLRFCTETMCDLHQVSHNVPDDYQGDVVCAGCDFVAADAVDLLKHVGRHGAKLYDHKLCRLCGEFVQDMVEHVQTKHKKEYVKYETRLTLPCDQCEKRFRTRMHVVTHKNIVHTSLQALGCLVCAKQFSSSSLLHGHIKKEHGKVLTCLVCQKRYSKYCRLYTHAKTHKEVHVCKTCGSVFRCKKSLEQHEYGHRSDYSFKCTLCGKTFKRPTNLMQHKMVVHTDKVRKKRKAQREEMRKKGVVSEYKCPRQRMRYEEFPYKCEECRLGWMLLGNLQQHQRKKHPDAPATVQSGKK
ncbi:uncharacterized protein LOC129585449 [Paramacrobiotus metropolitanus]|uniref:uncharacterized protein LOC129585449 n=1 Tax=Paramacrobiotus metropolitanus TaxID=2943436 RepID=UPI0024463529|nr:uncharacterized protein LOC129585449 [Paramacrobiotus metropolitanus]